MSSPLFQTPAGQKSHTRYVTLFALCICNCISFADRTVIGVTIMPMQKEFGWSTSTTGVILGSFYYGYTLTQIPGGRAAEIYGCKRVLIVAVFFWSVATIVTPLMAKISFSALIASRVLLGIAEGAHFPVVALFLSLWFPISERGRALTMTFMGVEAGTLIALMFAPWISQHLGWASNFYIFGTLGLVWCAFSQIHLASHPHLHPGISEEELAFITAGRDKPRDNRGQHYWRSMFLSKSFWAILLSHSCFTFVIHLLALWMPSYFHHNLKVEMESLPIYTVLPQVCNALISLLGGWLSDEGVKRGYSTLSMQRAACIIGFSIPALLLQFFWDVKTPEAGALLFCGVIGFIGLSAKCGHLVHLLDVMPHNVGSALGVINTVGSIMGVVSNMFAGWYIQTYESWGGLFSILGIILWSGMCMFIALTCTSTSTGNGNKTALASTFSSNKLSLTASTGD
jgi:ACS family sodium-dependent inorganic phosphate cotransporter